MQPETLQQLGLTQQQAKIYMALLELGPATVTDVTKKAGITRTLGYVVLDELGIQGLVSQVRDAGKKIKYSAEHPQALVQFVRNKKNSWARREEATQKMLPDLVSLYKVEDKPVIRYQEGASGLKTLFEETLTSTTEILSVTDLESWQDPELWDWAKSYFRERNRRHIKERILLLDTPQGRAWLKNYRPSPYTTYRLVTREQAKGLLSFGGELNIYEDKIMLAMSKRPHRMATIIASGTLAGILRSLFNIVWEAAKPPRHKK